MFTPSTKVFGIGLSKTGTSSLGQALNALGVASIHYPHDPITYEELASARYDLSILKKYQSITDIPVAPFYPQLDAVYPGSKFILTVRDLEPWLASVENHWAFMRDWARRDAHFRRFSEFITARVYGTHEYHRDRFVDVYHKHVEAVTDYFSGRPQDLLVLDICQGDGWEQLCTFLDIAVPEHPFPHANRKEEKRVRQTWIDQLDEAVAEFESVMPRGEPYILVDDGKLAGSLLDEPTARRLGERDGVYWGPPADSQAAIRELEGLRSEGATRLVLAWPSRWWLSHYDQFASFLETCCRQVYSGKQLHIYDLLPP